MRINIGSVAPPKIEGVLLALQDYGRSEGCTVRCMDVRSGVSSHPMSRDELVRGAMHRAVASYDARCNYSFGIEDGCEPYALSRTGWSTLSVCAIYDGKEFYHGHSAGFESPPAIMELRKFSAEIRVRA